MKKALVLFGVLALVVNMGLFADNLSDGKKYTKMAKEVFGDLTPSQMSQIYSKIDKTVDALGKISTGLDSYKYLKSFKEVVSWAAVYKDASSDADKITAAKNGSKQMLKMLDAFVSLAGGPLYGMILPTLLKSVDKTIDIIHLKNARIQLADWAAADTDRYYGWTWSAVCGMGYENLAVEIIAKYQGGLRPLAAVVRTIEELDKIKEITGQR